MFVFNDLSPLLSNVFFLPLKYKSKPYIIQGFEEHYSSPDLTWPNAAYKCYNYTCVSVNDVGQKCPRLGIG